MVARNIFDTALEMAEIVKEIARDEDQDPRTRIMAAAAAAKIMTPLASTLKLVHDTSVAEMDWASRVLERKGETDLMAQNEEAKEQRARAIARRHGKQIAIEHEEIPEW